MIKLDIMLKMNYVGKLQEYFAASGKALPRYETDRIGGTADKPKFQSKCITHCLSFTGDICKSKKEAKTSVAKQAYEYFTKSSTINESDDYDSDDDFTEDSNDEDINASDGIIFVDVENVPDFLPKFVKSEYYGRYILRACMSLNHPEAEDRMDEKDFYVFDSKAPNAADIGMSMLIASILVEFEPVVKPIFIVTNDAQYSVALADIIRTQSIADFDNDVHIVGYYQEFVNIVSGFTDEPVVVVKMEDRIYEIVKQSDGGMSKKDVRRAYSKVYGDIEVKEVNRILYSLRDDAKLKKTRSNPPIWTVI